MSKNARHAKQTKLSVIIPLLLLHSPALKSFNIISLFCQCQTRELRHWSVISTVSDQRITTPGNALVFSSYESK